MWCRFILVCGTTLSMLTAWAWEEPPKSADTGSGQGEAQATRDRMAPAPMPPRNWRVSPLEDAPYEPLRLKEKAYLFAYRSVQPSSLGKSLFTAGIAHLTNSPEQWGQGVEGFARRYGHRLATRGAENAIGFMIAAPLHQDPRYFRLEHGSIKRRLRHALSYVFLTRNDRGNKTFSAWRIGGNYGAQFVSNAWRPVNTSPGDALMRGTISLGYDAASNAFKEFWPDIRRRLKR